MFTREGLMNYTAKNEPILQFRAGSPERAELLKALDKYKNQTVSIPIVIGDEEFFDVGVEKIQPDPANHAHSVAKYRLAPEELIQKAIKQAVEARVAWEATPPEQRAAVFLKAADLLAGKYRAEVLATTMLGQGKTVFQAEIDAVVEMVDFFRFNVQFLGRLLQYAPVNTDIHSNSYHLRGTEGFWACIAPFNFTSIGGNLNASPALTGNVTLWKPSHSAVLSNYMIYKILREAGLPPNVIQFLPSQGSVLGKVVTASPDLAGINFTGGVPAFHYLWNEVGKNISKYKCLPRMIGELGGKNFHFVHPSCDDTVLKSAVNGTMQAAFEYGGQKCSAVSRLYVPTSLWPKFKDTILSELKQVKVGSPLEFDTFFSAVIDKESYDRIMGYIDYAKKHPEEMTIIAGGTGTEAVGYYIQPTIVVTTNPKCKLMQEEIFGPILTVYVYNETKGVEDTLKLIGNTCPYALTGSIWSSDKDATAKARMALRDACGNMYLNDKCTGAVVGQQPFGGSRWSGTNDKAGGPHYLLRFISPQTIKETHAPLTTWRYPYMSE